MPNPDCPNGHGEMGTYEVPPELEQMFPDTHNHYKCSTCEQITSIKKES